MLQPITAEKILDMWARKPLDFDPGTKWQYSNTNYVIAGVIIEKVSGMPLLQFLQQRVFTPLGMKAWPTPIRNKLGDTDPTGYMRYALGPAASCAEGRQGLAVRGRGAGDARRGSGAVGHLDHGSELVEAGVVSANWKPKFCLKNGVGTQYGLGVDVTTFRTSDAVARRRGVGLHGRKQCISR